MLVFFNVIELLGERTRDEVAREVSGNTLHQGPPRNEMRE